MPSALGNPIAFFCVVCLPLSTGKGNARLHWGSPNMELRAECFSCARITAAHSIWSPAPAISQGLPEINNGSHVGKNGSLGCLWDFQGQQPGPPPRAATWPPALLLLLLSLWCHAALCLTFFTFLRVILASGKRVEVKTKIESTRWQLVIN